MTDRSHDLVVYGVTGFTGRLVVRHLLEHAPPTVSWAAAGRDAGRVGDVLAELGADAVPVVVADADDDASLRRMVADARVVCTTVGPYDRYGSGLVEACADAGTHYCDLAGEPHWVRRMIDQHEPAARATGAQILHSCGFDSIPSDVGTWFVQQEMISRHGLPAVSVDARWKAMRGGASGGTIASLLDLLDDAVRDRDIRAVVTDPYGLNPAGDRHGPDRGVIRPPAHDDAFGGWTGPFVMAVINAKVVRRTNAVLGYPYGRDFRYDERLLTGRGPVGLATATGVLAGTAAGALGGALAGLVPALRPVVDRFVPSPGEGPSEAAQEAGFWDLRLHAEHPTDPDASLHAKVVGSGDPGYLSTSRMLAETALALAADEAVVGGGMWTPAAAVGDALLRRLPASAQVTFEVIHPPDPG